MNGWSGKRQNGKKGKGVDCYFGIIGSVIRLCEPYITSRRVLGCDLILYERSGEEA